MSDVTPSLESQSRRLVTLSYLLSRFSAWSSYSFCLVIFLLVVHSSEFFFEKTLEHVLLRVGLFCVALVEHLADDSW